jgi:hypothetical protein
MVRMIIVRIRNGKSASRLSTYGWPVMQARSVYCKRPGLRLVDRTLLAAGNAIRDNVAQHYFTRTRSTCPSVTQTLIELRNRLQRQTTWL